jgi:putative flippase GtrA
MEVAGLSILKQFMGREANPFIQFIKYGISGGLATATHIVIFHFAAWKFLPALQQNDIAVRLFHLSVQTMSDAVRARNAMIDNGLAFLISNLVAYVLNILWVFKPGRHHWIVEIGLFYLVSGVSIVIGTSIMGFLITQYSFATTTAFLANLVTALLINFAMRKFVIFKG